MNENCYDLYSNRVCWATLGFDGLHLIPHGELTVPERLRQTAPLLQRPVWFCGVVISCRCLPFTPASTAVNEMHAAQLRRGEVFLALSGESLGTVCA